jgi:hypothetical protein
MLTSFNVHGSPQTISAVNKPYIQRPFQIPLRMKREHVGAAPTFAKLIYSPVYGKIIDNIFLKRSVYFSEKLLSSELQFGFEAHSSTNVCSMVLKVTHRSSVFCIHFWMPAIKAFDKLHYCKPIIGYVFKYLYMLIVW